MTPTRNSPWWKKLLLSLAVFLICFVALEVGLRLRYQREFGKHRDGKTIFVKSSNPRLVYELRRSYSAVNPETGTLWKTNADGFRDREFAPKPSDRYRIIVVGDSVTVGWWQEPDQTYPNLLEQRFAQSPAYDADVFNLGVSGYNTLQEVELIEAKGLSFSPNLVVVSYVLNDNIAWGGGQLTRAFRHSGCMVLDQLRMRFERLRYALDKSLVAVAFERLDKVSRQHDMPVVVVVFPYLAINDDGTYPYQAEHDTVANLAEQHGFLCLDLLDEYRAAGMETLRLNEKDITHPNARGHRVASDAIFEFLKSNAGRIGLTAAPTRPHQDPIASERARH